VSKEQKKGQGSPGVGSSHLAQSSRNDELLADYLGELFNTPATEPLPDAVHDLSIRYSDDLESGKALSTASDKVALPENEAPLGPEDQQRTANKSDDSGGADGLSGSLVSTGEEAVSLKPSTVPVDDADQEHFDSLQEANVNPFTPQSETKPACKAKLIRGDELLKRSKELPFKDAPLEQMAQVLSGLMPKMKTELTVEPAAEAQLQEPALEQQVTSDEKLATLKSDIKQEIKTELKPELKAELKKELKGEMKAELKTEVGSEVTAKIEKDIKEIKDVKDELESQVARLDVSVTETVAQQPPQQPPESPPKIKRFRELDAFEALIFEVRGLQLAVPLISLGSIHHLDDEITPIFGRADWYLGMYRVNDRNLQVVDTARWVMPSRGAATSEEEYDFVIRLGDTNWGLACSSVHQSMRIRQSEVKWRTANSKRPWLAGTVIAKMCALLDVDNMAELLEQDKLQGAG